MYDKFMFEFISVLKIKLYIIKKCSVILYQFIKMKIENYQDVIIFYNNTAKIIL